MSRHNNLLMAILLTALILLVACGQESDTPARATPKASIPLEGSEWLLASLRGESLLEGSRITINLDGDRFEGLAGCNNYGGQYEVAEGGRLRISEIFVTAMACSSPEGIMEQETAYIQALGRSATFRLADGRLEMAGESGETILLFDRKAEFDTDTSTLLGTVWRLVSIDGESFSGGSTFTLAFYSQTILYRALRTETGGNLLYSPYSLSLALAMAYAGARGETEGQMAGTLHFSLPQERLHPAFNALDQELGRRGQGSGGTDGQGFRLNVVNALWGQEDYSFLSEFLDLLAANYGAEMRRLDFGREEKARKAINDWVNNQTGGRIQELVPTGALDASTRLVLTNAVYFNAAWARPFDPRATRDGAFHLFDGSAVTVPMMQQVAPLAYAEGQDYQALELPYDGHEIAMVILLPAQGQFEAFESALDARQIEAILEGLAERQVVLTLPRFEFEAGFKLGASLAAMGMPLAFVPQADFSGMTPGGELFVSDVIHRATISVGELGTEAAAATAGVMPPSAIPEDLVTVRGDRPFLFVIRDLQTGTTLFLGRVVDPSASLQG
jgi:serpin B